LNFNVDELADWQFQILSEYSKVGSSLMEQSMVYMAPLLSALVGVLFGGAIFVGQTSPLLWVFAFGILLGVIAFVVSIYNRMKGIKKRTALIEGALARLVDGKPIDQTEFTGILNQLRGIEEF
jgi:positive regulator of sigma E activity